MDDLISRRKVIEVIRNYWKKRLDTLPTKMMDGCEVYADIKSMDKILEHNKIMTGLIKQLPSAQPEKAQLSQEDATFDCISRQVAIDALAKYCDDACIYSEKQRSVMCGACPLGDAFDVIEGLPSAQPGIIRCKDCKHRPVTNDDYDDDEWDCGFNIKFPDHKCPCRCDDGFYNWLPDDNWFCGNAERRTDE